MAVNPSNLRFLLLFTNYCDLKKLALGICFGGSLGGLPGLLIGAFIIIIGLTYAFSRDFSMIMGSWGENVGRFFAEGGRTSVARWAP